MNKRAIKRRAGWIQTRSGRRFSPLAPEAAQVEISDIAFSLSNLCRFTGHCHPFYSVAEHSVRVARACCGEAEPLAVWALLHDAAEAYIGDISSPFKRELLTIHADSIRQVEERILRCIGERYALQWPDEWEWARIHAADKRLFATECRDLMRELADDQEELPAPLAAPILPWISSVAYKEFLYYFDLYRGNSCNPAIA